MAQNDGVGMAYLQNNDLFLVVSELSLIIVNVSDESSLEKFFFFHENALENVDLFLKRYIVLKDMMLM